jgi:hypothetical protein
VRNTTNEETANNKSSFSKRRRPDSAYSSHQSIRDEEVSGESGYRTSLTMSALSNPFSAHYSLHSEEWSSLLFYDLCFDDHGSFVIFRSASVRPKHLFDPYFEP